ncbi:MAG: hypothetical protein NZ772_17155, partial [Cyanobacteria bacterium]|nr:hypothetical protein [Cyanobacteriota bacterium]
VKVAPKLALDQLFRLHGLSWQDNRPPLNAPILPEAAGAIAHFHQFPDLAQAWRNWCNRQLRSVAKNEFSRWRSPISTGIASYKHSSQWTHETGTEH